MQNFVQIPPRGLLGKWVKYTQKFLFIYAFFLQRTHRSDPLRDFYAENVKRRGSAQGSAFLVL